MLAEGTPTKEDIATVREMLRRDPDLNLYLLAFENPDLEPAALAIAHEGDACQRCEGTGWLAPIDKSDFDGSFTTSRPCPNCSGIQD
jgi:hypothetical protein